MLTKFKTLLRTIVTFFSVKENDNRPDYYGSLYCPPPPCSDDVCCGPVLAGMGYGPSRSPIFMRVECDNTMWTAPRPDLVPVNRRERRDMRFKGPKSFNAPDSLKPAVPYYIAQLSGRDKAKQLRSIGSGRNATITARRR